ncbi:hypothetical protein GCM10027184_55950 [Saccharothrix stipae]
MKAESATGRHPQRRPISGPLQAADLHRGSYRDLMTRKPPDHSWRGFTEEHANLLDRLDFYGNNDWARNSQSEAIMPMLLGELHEAGLDLDRVKEALGSIGYSQAVLHQLDRWESKRTTGKFGK